VTKGFIRPRGKTFTAYWNLLDPATGKWKQHTRGGFKTKGAAQQFLNGVLGKVADNSWRPDKPLTVSQLLNDHWLPAQEARGLRPATLAQYRRVADAWIKPRVGEVKVAALTPAHVNAMVDGLRTDTSSRKRDGLSPRSAQLSVGLLKAACKWALENGLVGRNPLVGVRRPSARSKTMTAWSVDEARAFLKATADDQLASVWALALTRGLRRGELCGLRWSDIDLDPGRIAITRTRVVVDGRAVDSDPKTAAGVRSVPLDPSLVTLLRPRRVQQSAEKLAAGPAYSDGGYVVSDELGEPIHPDTLSERFDKAVKAAQLRRIRLHDCRHTAASLMLASGVPVKVVSEMLGHSSPTITLSIYAHTLPGMAEKAGAALSASLLG
jgi:integrase